MFSLKLRQKTPGDLPRDFFVRSCDPIAVPKKLGLVVFVLWVAVLESDPH